MIHFIMMLSTFSSFVQLEKVEAELQKYKGCEERERVLKIEVEKLKTSLSEKDMILHDREAR